MNREVCLDFQIPERTSSYEDAMALNSLYLEHTQDSNVTRVRVHLFSARTIGYILIGYNRILAENCCLARVRPAVPFDQYGHSDNVVCYLEPPGLEELAGLNG
jgi:hypothetical protein